MRRTGRALVLATVTAGCGFGCGSPRSGLAATELWREHCAVCHGDDGRGVPARRGLDSRLDLRRSEMLAADDRGLAFQRIAYGYATMPGFAHKLPRGDMELLVELAAELARR